MSWRLRLLAVFAVCIGGLAAVHGAASSLAAEGGLLAPGRSRDPVTEGIDASRRGTPHSGPLAQALPGQLLAGDGALAWGPTGTGPLFLPALGTVRLRLTGEAKAVAVLEDHAYVGSGASIGVVDASDPSAPRLVGMTEPVAEDCTVTDLKTSGTHVYALCFLHDANLGRTGVKEVLAVIDAAAPSRPRIVGRLGIEEMAYTMTVLDSWVYVGGWWLQLEPYAEGKGIVLIDASDPTSPRRRAFVETGTYTLAQALSGETLYLAGGEYDEGPRVSVVDVGDPAAPRPVALLDSDALGHLRGFPLVSVAVLDDTAYVAGQSGSIVTVLDIADPANPVPLAQLEPPAAWYAEFATAGGYWLAVGRVLSLDMLHVFRPYDPEAGEDLEAHLEGAAILPSCLPRRWRSSPIATQGDLVYLACGDVGGLAIVSIEDPTDPRTVGVVGLELPGAPVAGPAPR